MNMQQNKAVERVARLERAVGSQALSGVTLESQRAKSAMASLLLQATSPDFDPAIARQSIIAAMGLEKGTGQ